jgi:DNA-binding transcriptional ArsR family regulator
MNPGREALAKEQAEFHQVFSSERRILIMWLLESQELPVTEIAERIGASIQNTSQHLRLMRDKGILDSRRDGQTIYYSIKNNNLGNNCRKMLNAIQLSRDNGI